MAFVATVDLRGSCPKKKNDPTSEKVGFSIDAGQRIPSKTPRYMVENWLRTKHVVRVDDDELKDDGTALNEDFYDDLEFPADISEMSVLGPDGKPLLKPEPLDEKRIAAENLLKEKQRNDEIKRLASNIQSAKDADKIGGRSELTETGTERGRHIVDPNSNKDRNVGETGNRDLPGGPHDPKHAEANTSDEQSTLTVDSDRKEEKDSKKNKK